MAAQERALFLTWPPSLLGPHGRGGWDNKRRAMALLRQTARKLCAKAFPTLKAGPQEALYVELTFIPPDSRRYELANLEHRMAAALSGFADYLELEPERVIAQSRLSLVPTPGGLVKVTFKVMGKPLRPDPNKPYKSGSYRSPGQRAERPR